MNHAQKYGLIKFAVNFENYGPDKLQDYFMDVAGKDEKLQQKGNIIADLFRRHLKNPDFEPSGATLPRSKISADRISEKDFENLGYFPSYVAVPERGQSQIKTYRHPFSGTHFHKHDDNWFAHYDKWPSFSQTRKQFKLKNPGAGIKEQLQHAWDVGIKESLPHVMVEGVPGYINYAYNTLADTSNFQDFMNDGAKQISPQTQFSNVAKSIAGITGASLLGKTLYDRAVNLKQPSAKSLLSTGSTTAGALSGFAGSTFLTNKLIDYLGNTKNIKDFQHPTAASAALMTGVPLLATIAGGYLGNRAADSFSKKITEDQKKEDQEKKLPKTKKKNNKY